MANDRAIDFVCEPVECTGCGACTLVCKFGALAMEVDKEGFWAPRVSREACIGCGACRRACPSANEAVRHPESAFYMAWNTDEKVLERCSSGGVFDALACYVFERKGAVFGVAMDPETRDLRHVRVESAEDIDRLRRSKYFQSFAADAMAEALGLLRDGRWVLFTGTACQIAGMMALAEREKGLDASKLLTMDVLCHGVTSKRVVDAYVASKEAAAGAPAVDMGFRCKRGKLGWAKGCGTTTTTTHLFPDGRVEEMVDEVDMRGTFFAGFNRNLFLRESCYRCRYCGVNRVADFTAADFWGVSPERVSAWQYWHGVSLLLANSDKARSMLADLGQWLHVEGVLPSDAIPHNRALAEPNTRPALRDSFFSDLDGCGYDELIHRYYGKEISVGDFKRKARGILGDGLYDKLKRLAGRG